MADDDTFEETSLRSRTEADPSPADSAWVRLEHAASAAGREEAWVRALVRTGRIDHEERGTHVLVRLPQVRAEAAKDISVPLCRPSQA